MSPPSGAPVNVVGAGLAGGLLAVTLARRGYPVRVYERRPDPRRGPAEAGRSINLALSARGLRALGLAGVMARVEPLLIPMRGRLVHEHDGAETLLPYGRAEHEVNYSVSRAALGTALIEAAATHANVELHFDVACIDADPAADRLELKGADGNTHVVPLRTTFATDGAGSAVRNALVRRGLVRSEESLLEHDYLELTIPPGAGPRPLMREALHIWPRGGFMLIALPNTDGSFTATLFLPRSGPESFESLATDADIRSFFAREFPAARGWLPRLIEDFHEHPQSRLGTVRSSPWHSGDSVLLLGDAAHAMVPFHGQGMNCAFEDIAVLDSLIERHDDWAAVFAAYGLARRDDVEAIALMALENYEEMRDTVLDEGFRRRKRIALRLEERFPDRFIPRYSMVTFHPEIGYAEALRRGREQQALLHEIDERFGDGALESPAVAELVRTRLRAFARA